MARMEAKLALIESQQEFVRNQVKNMCNSKENVCNSTHNVNNNDGQNGTDIAHKNAAHSSAMECHEDLKDRQTDMEKKAQMEEECMKKVMQMYSARIEEIGE